MHGDIVTLRRLLDHTSGMPDFMRNRDWQRQVEADPQAVWQLADALAFIEGQGLGFIPGTEYRYSATNYALLGAVLASVTDRPLSQLLHTEFSPRLPNTGATANRPQPSLARFRYAHPQYLFKPGPTLTDISTWSTGWTVGAGSGYSTVDDMMVFAHQYLRQIASQQDAITWSDTRERGWQYAQGVWLYEGALVLRGDWHGHSVMVGYVPEYDMGFVVASNLSLTRSGTAPAQFIGRAIIEKLYGMR
jgi:CubicO group peptidase (beta-lactamase class C family)